ncbi:hypothetical protein JQX13_51230 [Archangium violaceum]|uniref:hypothetical protein n=1 Tax=Archangium violaceum TaxID=83451 RepID=UPI00193BA00F|nr:hypothetical protein [Archangium violaceum]QRK08215.1 hypothetical protein JQX13_51230 [Archangium violaceum]
MYSTSLRTAVLGLLLAAGLASAESPKKKDAKPTPPKPAVTKVPKTCADQCELLNTFCADPCNKIKNNEPAKAACKNNCTQMASTCNGSCKSKGKIDEKYMMEHIKVPKAPPGVKVRDE